MIVNNLHNRKHQRGLSLVELMISLVISLILLAGLTTLIVQQSQTRDELEKSSRQIENGRYAMQILHEDIQHAGFYGQYFNVPTWGSAPGVLPNPCATDVASLTAAMPLAIQGYNNVAASPLACINSANILAGSDILVIRRAGSNRLDFAGLTTAAALDAGQVYIQTNTAGVTMGVGAGAQANTTDYPRVYDEPPNGTGAVHAPLRSYQVHIYFVSPCSTMANGATCAATDDNGSPLPTLKRLDLSTNAGATAWVLTPLVEGIESLQLDFGVDGDSTIVPPEPLIDGYPDVYCANPDDTAATCPVNSLPALAVSNPTNWAHVMSVRVNVLARNTECTTAYTDTKSYGMGLTPQANNCANGGYKRHAFSEMVRVVNPSGRRARQ
jgi:type IV pilus assembly protein PilW